MTPSVGRIVHYVSRGSTDGVFPSVCRAAIVVDDTGRDSGSLGLMVCNPSGIFFDVLVQHDENMHMPATWHWPERVE